MRILKLMISLVYFIIDLIIQILYKIAGKEKENYIVILYYHSIKNTEKKLFNDQMIYLFKYTNPIPINYNAPLLSNYRYVVITFDDGLRSVIDNALPILKKYNIPATFFIPTGYIGKIADWENKSHQERYSESVITKEDIANLPYKIISVGSHTISHKDLTNLSENEILNEIKHSKDTLESILNKKIEMLSFPYGAYNSEISQLARKNEYIYILSSSPKIVKVKKMKDEVLGRFPVQPTDWSIEFRLKVRGAYRWLPIAFQFKKSMQKMLWN
jgi:peptidoglycan/xylan/chitin deacetylase (PgdA/CDA1 family)